MSEPRFDPLGALRTFTEHGVRFVLIGGFAGALRGSPVLTGDIDICYARDDANLQALAAALEELGARLRGAPEDIPFRLDAATLKAGDHFTFSTNSGPIDCLGMPAGTDGFADLDASATEEDLDGLTVGVASIDDLIRMKLAAGRPQDLIAVEWFSALRDELDQRDS
ncbi:MAG: hypothetical protein M3P18_16845 [Actinomycetota bacterium]|nr:hypothetical protein [Actinomycetota bacterium]